MTFTVEIVYGEGPPARHGGIFEDRATTLDHALSLADDLGRTFSSGERGWPQRVSIHRDGELDITIHVIRGGLLGEAEHEGLIEL